MKPDEIYISYSKVNQAYFVMFYDQILKILNTKKEADSYLTEICNKISPTYEEELNKKAQEGYMEFLKNNNKNKGGLKNG
jgi:hypothetical protein